MEKRKVFLVDDEQDLLDSYEIALRGNYELSKFQSPKLLIQAIEAGQLPDVFVTDIKMPEMDGLQLIAWARNKKIEKPFVVVSGHAEKSHAIQALKLGAVDFIEKPFPVELFRSVVKRAVVHSVYQLLRIDMLTKYQKLSETLVDLTRNYETRFQAAEDELYKMNRLSDMGKDKVNQLLKTTRESVALEKVVDSAQSSIRELMLLEEEIRTIMGSGS